MLMTSRVTFHYLGRCFHLGSRVAVWKVSEIKDETILCQMIGTEDLVVLPHETVLELIEEYEDQYADMYYNS